jgi:hypothetical protein
LNFCKKKLKKRILVTIVGQGSITHIIRTGLAERMKSFCEPVIAIQWNQEDLIAELKQNKFEVHIIPACEFSFEYSQLRLQISNWYYKKILRSPSTKIDKDYWAQFWPLKKWIQVKIRRLIQDFVQNFIPGYVKNLIEKENVLVVKEAPYIFYEKWLSALNIQGLFTVTPFLQEVEILGRILNGRKMPVVASIHSFDNITKRGWPAFFFDHYIVWNKYNKAELQRINPSLRDNDISITGPPQFDLHFNEDLFKSKKEWLKDFGLPENKKIILYGGGSGFLFRYEPQYLKHLEDAFNEGRIREDAVVLFRPHPLDKMDRWQKYIGESKFIVFKKKFSNQDKLDFANVTMESISQFVSTLKYTDIHINLCSTMSVDGSVFDKPQIGPFYDAIIPKKQGWLRKMYYQEHFLRILKLNAVHLARSKEELIDLVNKALANPEVYNKSCKKCVEEIITYTDGRSTNRVASILRGFFVL